MDKLRGATVAALVALGAPSRAGADASSLPVHVVVDCPDLEAEDQAALESRATADLLVRSRQGNLTVRCAAGRLTLLWRPVGKPARWIEHPRGSDQSTTTEVALAAIDELLAKWQEPESSASAPPTAAYPALPFAPPETRVPPRRDTSALDPPMSSPPAEASQASTGVLLGATGEAWSAEIRGGVGPRASIVWRPMPPLALEADGDVLFSLGAPDSVSARVIRGHLGAGVDLDEAESVWVGATAFAAALSAIPVASDSETAHEWTFGATLGGRFAAGAEPVRAFVGAALVAYPGMPHVEVSGEEIFGWPVLTGQLTFGVALGPFLTSRAEGKKMSRKAARFGRLGSHTGT